MDGSPSDQPAHGLATAQRAQGGRLLGRCYCGAEWLVESLPELLARLEAHERRR